MPKSRLNQGASNHALSVTTPDVPVDIMGLCNFTTPPTVGGVAISATYVPAVVMPPATGDATTDAANFTSALASVPSSGGVIQLLPTPSASYNFSAGVTIAKPVVVAGMGASNGPLSTVLGNSATAITRIISTSATGNAITITSDGVVLRDFALINTALSTPTAGAGISVTSNGAAIHYRGITVAGFYRCVDVVTGFEWTMSECIIYDYVKTGLRIRNTPLPDGGDMGIVNNQFVAGPTNLTPQAAVEWCSGGGLRFTGNKVNNRNPSINLIGLWLHPDDGIGTAVFVIVGNSLEGCTYIIYCDDTGNTGTGFIDNVVIVGNELLGGITFTRVVATGVKHVTIAGNHLNGGMNLKNIQGVVIGSNYSNVATPLTIVSGITGLVIKGNPWTTAARPAATVCAPGSWYWDTTLTKPVWSDGTTWKDAAGSAV